MSNDQDGLGGTDPQDQLNDLRMSEKAVPLLNHVKRFIRETVDPMHEEWLTLSEGHADRWSYAPGQLELLQTAKDKAKEEGLWNFFLPDAETGEGLSNLDYAFIAIELGKSPLASQVMNCSAPDTGNMEVLERVGTPEQKKQWLQPLLDGEIRSAYAMTEPDVATSDAKNVQTAAVLENGEWVINGEKHYISGAGDPRCKIMIMMVKTNDDGERGRNHSQILVPMDTPGVEIVGPMHVFGDDHAPAGHMHIRLTDVRVPESNMLLGEGRGFEISQLRLGPGRIHHCMRTIGKAEVALDYLVKRGNSRTAFGQPLSKLGGNLEKISRARIEIESMRLLVLKAAKAMDVLGNKEARVWVSMAKAAVPEKACLIIDQAIQIHGAYGMSQFTPLPDLYADVRHLRFADGPDEVHHMVVGRHELSQH
ncbi:MAG: acyl-CoA dehydrogenase family protein [Brevibacterium yomogidense]